MHQPPLQVTDPEALGDIIQQNLSPVVPKPPREHLQGHSFLSSTKEASPELRKQTAEGGKERVIINRKLGLGQARLPARD